MYCPKCRVEYREDFTKCSDCNVKLVSELPPEQVTEYEDLVTVFDGDSGSSSVARATLEGAGIKSWIKDEDVHGLFPSLGPTEILVCSEDEKRALRVLEGPKHHARVPHGSGRPIPR